MNCPHKTSEVCLWCEAAIELHNTIVTDDMELMVFSSEWIEAVQHAALNYRTIIGKHPGVGINKGGRIVPPEERERLYPPS